MQEPPHLPTVLVCNVSDVEADQPPCAPNASLTINANSVCEASNYLTLGSWVGEHTTSGNGTVLYVVIVRI